MPSRYFRIHFLLLLLVLLIGSSFYVEAAFYRSYTFDAWGRAVPTPDSYLPVRTIYGNDIGVGDLRGPEDLFVASDGTIYIADSRNNRIISLTSDFDLVKVYDQFVNDDVIEKFNNPQGVFVTDDGQLLVADTSNARIVRLDLDGNLINIIKDPERDNPEPFPDYFNFRPRRIVVDQVGRLYTISAGLFEGVMELDLEGNFRTFMGAPRVSLSAWDYFWARIATDEQRQRRRLILPTEYSSVDLDQLGFLYTTVSTENIESEQIIRRLSPAGNDILKRNGFHPPMGDINVGENFLSVSEITGNSVLVDIVARENGIYSVLDQKRGRVFTYDNSGNLLYVFGGVGQGMGVFVGAVAIDQIGNQLLVLDNRTHSITVFEPTEYALLIHQAIAEYEDGNYQESADLWHRVITLNANNELAYSGVAEAHLRQADYEQAMHFYRLGNDRPGYSEAFYRYRREVLGNNFGKIMSGIIGLVVLVYISIKRQWRTRLANRYQKSQVAATLASDRVQKNRFFAYLKRTWAGIKYVKHIVFHPFDGFWDLKHEKRGSFSSATVILALSILSFVFMRQYTGFVINKNRIENMNVLIEITSVLLPFLLWCIVNWALTTLMDGKGTMMEIYISGAYALAPLIFIFIPITIFSNYITIDEATFYHLLVWFAVIWALSLLFIGNGVTHDYSFGKIFLTTIASILGIGIVLFVCLLFFNVIDRMIRFVQDIYIETSFRL